jgi:hypothetical protein
MFHFIYGMSSFPTDELSFFKMVNAPTRYNIYKVQVSPQLHGEATYHHLEVNSLGQCFIFWLGWFCHHGISSIALQLIEVKLCVMIWCSKRYSCKLQSLAGNTTMPWSGAGASSSDECPLKMSFHSLEERVAPQKK